MVPCGSALLRSTPQCIIQVTIASYGEMYTGRGPDFMGNKSYGVQAEVTLMGLQHRRRTSKGVDAVVLQCLNVLSDRAALPGGVPRSFVLHALLKVIHLMETRVEKQAPETRRALASATRKLAIGLRHRSTEPSEELEGSAQQAAQELETWAQQLRTGKQTKPKKRAKRKKRRATA